MSEGWLPKYGDKYWLVDFGYTGKVRSAIWDNDKVDSRTYFCGNCFRTKEKAEAAAEKVKELLLSLHEPTTTSSQLPKLTTEVFEREDCPKWAKWAAVDMNGIAHYFDERPYPMDTFFYNSRAHQWSVDGDFDASNWKNSLIERTAKDMPKMTAEDLPKLTVEVFDRPDCPEWAKYASLDGHGMLTFYEDKPMMSKDEYPKRWINYDRWYPVEGTKFDSSDWQNSLVGRPVKALPDWCKVDAIGWHKRCGYFRVTYIDNVSKRVDIRQVDDRSEWYLSFHTVCNETVQARPRPYNEYEMEALVGKAIETPNGNVYLCTAYQKPNDAYEAAVDVDTWVSASGLLEDGYKLNGKPCGKLEHLNEKGEWVE